MLNKAGSPGSVNYLFLGDYVDRGIFGIQVILLLLSLKINYPKKIILLRGNHESRCMTENFSFRQEVLETYNEFVYNAFMEVFDSMPLACVVDDKYLAMHGGISPSLEKIEEIQKINRFQEVPLHDCLMCDLLWADPMKDEIATTSKDRFMPNDDRDCSYFFGLKPTKKLLRKNKLISIIRGHQVQVEGFKMHKWEGPQSFPFVITVFSAPNYCGYYDNKASVLIINEGDLSLKQFEETDPPYRLPNNMDVFQWSLPFLAQKVMSMLINIVQKIGDVEEQEV